MYLMIPLGFLIGLIAMLDDQFDGFAFAEEEIERERGAYAAFFECLDLLVF